MHLREELQLVVVRLENCRLFKQRQGELGPTCRRIGSPKRCKRSDRVGLECQRTIEMFDGIFVFARLLIG